MTSQSLAGAAEETSRQVQSVSAASEQAGVNVQTVRYYERRGLLPEPERRESGYREYTPDCLERLQFIRRSQELGFTLSEIEEREDDKLDEAYRLGMGYLDKLPTGDTIVDSYTQCSMIGGMASAPWCTSAV